MKSTPSSYPSRRRFLSTTGGVTASALLTKVIGLPMLMPLTESDTWAEIGPENGHRRCIRAEKIRKDAAQAQRQVPIPEHPDNGDENLYPNKIGNYSKGLRHDPETGEVDLAAYNALIQAISSGQHDDFESLVKYNHFGCSDPARQRRLVNPQSSYAFDLEGTDSHQLAIRPAPAFSSAEEAGEMVELYWMALLRDVNFEDYARHPLAQAAASDLSRLSDFRGPKVAGQVTAQTLFRDNYPGCTTGPYISQFLLQPAAFGSQRIDQRILTNVPGLDYMTDFQSWLDVQNGFQPAQSVTPDRLVFCRNGRDLSQYVHVDVLFQAYFVAMLILLNGGYLSDAGNPYGQVLDPGSGRPLRAGQEGSLSQVGFATFGGPTIAALVCEPATRALKAQWYQKWLVHRRLRPEEFGGRVEVMRRGRRNYPFHSDLMKSAALKQIFSRYSSYLLPMSFPEGSPMHTSYASGHATVGGASVTMLKAFFDESAIIRNPIVPSPDGSQLLPYIGPPLTVGGELNKLVSNISQGRNIAGVHWRTDATEGVKLGEAVAISILRDTQSCYNENFDGFSLTKFDGTTIKV